MAYYTKSGGTYPDSLELLVMRDPNTGTPPLLEGGERAIIDPWRQPFQFEIVMDDAGAERFVVYTTSPEGQAHPVARGSDRESPPREARRRDDRPTAAGPATR